jgi:hypothetical protein
MPCKQCPECAHSDVSSSKRAAVVLLGSQTPGIGRSRYFVSCSSRYVHILMQEAHLCCRQSPHAACRGKQHQAPKGQHPMVLGSAVAAPGHLFRCQAMKVLALTAIAQRFAKRPSGGAMQQQAVACCTDAVHPQTVKRRSDSITISKYVAAVYVRTEHTAALLIAHRLTTASTVR